MMTPSIGVELPDLAFYEPCFGQELEWILLSALDKIQTRQESTYLRLTTKATNQDLFITPQNDHARESLRQQVINGAYRLIDRRNNAGYDPNSNAINIFACGAILPNAITASESLLEEGIYANVINVTGPGPLYNRYQECVHSTVRAKNIRTEFLSDVLEKTEQKMPIVTVVDGHPHTLAWIGGALQTKTLPLGVTRYGQSGNPDDLYKEYEIDSDSIMAAGFAALDL